MKTRVNGCKQLRDVQNFIAGVSLSGYRLKDGKVQAVLGGEIIDEWPKEINVFGTEYVFEYEEEGKMREDGRVFVEAVYC